MSVPELNDEQIQALALLMKCIETDIERVNRDLFPYNRKGDSGATLTFEDKKSNITTCYFTSLFVDEKATMRDLKLLAQQMDVSL